MGVFVRKIKDLTFEIHSRDSNERCGGDPRSYCKDVQSMIIRCANQSRGDKTGCDNTLGIEFLVHAVPSWQHQQRPGSNSCGHHQAVNCVLAAAGLMDTHIVDDFSMEKCKRHMLWQIIKRDNTLPIPYQRNQSCGDEPVTLSTRDVFIKFMGDNSKIVDCRPAVTHLNNITRNKDVFRASAVRCRVFESFLRSSGFPLLNWR